MSRAVFSLPVLLLAKVLILFSSNSVSPANGNSINSLFCVASCIARCDEQRQTSSTNADCIQNCQTLKSEKCRLPRFSNVTTFISLDHNLHDLTDRPYESIITWDSVPGAAYILEWRTLDIDAWKMKSDVIRGTTFNFTKADGPCAIYSFRVTPVTGRGVGIASVPESSGPAKVSYNNPEDMYNKVTDIRIIDDKYANVTVEFNLALDWKYPDYTPEINWVPYQCKASIRDQKVYQSGAYFVLRKDCVGIFVLKGVDTKCQRGRVKDIPNAYRQKMFASYREGDCLKYPGCTTKKPSCVHAFMCGVQLNATAQPGCYADKIDVDVHWKYVPRAESYEHCVPSAVYVEHGFIEENNVDNPIDAELVGDVREISRQFYLPNVTTRNFIIAEYPNETMFVRSCVVFNRKKLQTDTKVRTDFRRSLITADRVTIDLQSYQHCVDKQPLKTNIALIVAPLIAALLCLLIVIAIVFFKAHQQSRRLKESEAQQNFYQNFSPGLEPGDIWEIDRRLLYIDEEDSLGKGAFGKVYKGQVKGRAINALEAKATIATEQEKADNMVVAVKQCHEYADDQTKRDFLQEIELMKKLYSHPRLVNIVFCISKTEPYSLIVEYCELGDLLKVLRASRDYMIQVQERGVDLTSNDIPEDIDLNMIMSFKEVATMGYQVADGMEYISQNGYIHRDLAARNVLVSGNRSLKIGDFGLTRYVVSDAYMTRGGKLPVKWLAIEALETYEFSSKSDVWSYGVLLFEMITLGGVPYANIFPIDGDFRLAMLNYLLEGSRMEQPPNCPNELYDLMLAAWKAQQDDRPSFTHIKDLLREMIENLTESEGDTYSDFYIDPQRQYYNVTHPDDEMEENPKIYPFEISEKGDPNKLPISDTPADASLPAPLQKTEINSEGKTKLTESRSTESGIVSDEPNSPRRISMESFNSTAPLVSPRTPKNNRNSTSNFPILYELSEAPVHL